MMERYYDTSHKILNKTKLSIDLPTQVREDLVIKKLERWDQLRDMQYAKYTKLVNLYWLSQKYLYNIGCTSGIRHETYALVNIVKFTFNVRL